MSSRKKIKELEELRDRVEKLVPRAMGKGEHDLGHQLVQLAGKLQQKIDGHKANLKRKK